MSIKDWKENILNAFEKESYKDSKSVNVVWSIGDGGEYTKEQAEVMAEFYNNGFIEVSWLIDDKKRTWAFQELKDLGIIENIEYEEVKILFDTNQKQIKRTKTKYVDIKR